MSSLPITYKNLHLLWPRGDGAVRMLMYFWRITCQGNIPNFTDKYLGNHFNRAPATIARWRARWESKGILLTTTRCRRTFYEVNTVALKEAIEEAVAAQEEREAEQKAKEIARRVKVSTEISENLRQQWQQAHSQSDHFDQLSPIAIGGNTTSISNQSSVTDKPVNGLAANDGLSGIEETKPFQAATPQREEVAIPSLQNNEPPKMGANCDSQDLNGDSMREWMMEAARRLVVQRGQRWNKNLEKLIRETGTPLVIRAVSSLWEQSQRGNVREAPKFLTRAIQRKYSCSKGWILPSELPSVPAQYSGVQVSPASSAIPLFPDWLPAWATAWLENVLASGKQIDRFELVDGGVQVWTERGIVFQPMPSGVS